MNHLQKKITARIIILLAAALMLLLFTSCQIEFANYKCDDINAYYNKKIQDVYDGCVGKCQVEDQVKEIEKLRFNALKDNGC